MWWVVAGLVVVVFWMRSRLQSYERLFAVSHLMEFGQALPALKAQALQDAMAGGEGVAPGPGDGRAMLTSAGLAFVYPVSLDSASKHVHHASVSIPGQVTAHAVGEMFILLWARLLGVGYERLVVQASEAAVDHGEFVLDDSEQAAFVRHSVESQTVDGLKAFQAECLEVRQVMRRRQGFAVAGGERRGQVQPRSARRQFHSA